MLRKLTSDLDFHEIFATDAVCEMYLSQIRWKNMPTCPCCCHDRIWQYDIQTGRKTKHFYRCANCDLQFSIKKGTIFENSNIPLRKWFLAIYLLVSAAKSISSVELAKRIGVSQRTAWRMAHTIRVAMTEDAGVQLLTDIVEVDETYVGGKNKNKHYSKRIKHTQGRSTTDKVAVFGILQRNGKVKTYVVNSVDRKTLHTLICENVEPGATIMSDEWKAYRGLNKRYTHKVVEHGKYQYVNGDCYTNTLENFWSHLKRNIMGIFHWISRKHTPKYLKEFEYRRIYRNDDTQSKFDQILSQTIGKFFSYNLLVNC